LIVETRHRTALAKGMQSFLISAARHINRTVGGRGCVFRDRYHATPLKTPRQVRACMSYVLNNWRRHGEDQHRGWTLDPFSSGILFHGWKNLEAVQRPYRAPPGYSVLIVWLPRTWLLSKGWREHGLIDAFEVPT
jgi:hypothetical protein